MNILSKFGIKGKPKTYFKTCPDCGIKSGNLHKKGCDLGPENNNPRKFTGYLGE